MSEGVATTRGRPRKGWATCIRSSPRSCVTTQTLTSGRISSRGGDGAADGAPPLVFSRDEGAGRDDAAAAGYETDGGAAAALAADAWRFCDAPAPGLEVEPR